VWSLTAGDKNQLRYVELTTPTGGTGAYTMTITAN
jgi:hypothetical protein